MTASFDNRNKKNNLFANIPSRSDINHNQFLTQSTCLENKADSQFLIENRQSNHEANKKFFNDEIYTHSKVGYDPRKRNTSLNNKTYHMSADKVKSIKTEFRMKKAAP